VLVSDGGDVGRGDVREYVCGMEGDKAIGWTGNDAGREWPCETVRARGGGVMDTSLAFLGAGRSSQESAVRRPHDFDKRFEWFCELP
jgi:hypothetical protein